MTTLEHATEGCTECRETVKRAHREAGIRLHEPAKCSTPDWREDYARATTRTGRGWGYRG